MNTSQTSSRPRKRRLLVGLLLFGMLLAAAIVTGLLLDLFPSYVSWAWGESLERQVPSPDGRFVALLYDGGDGALGDDTCHLHLHDHRFRAVTSIRKSYSEWDAPGFILSTQYYPQLRWLTPRHLLVHRVPERNDDTAEEELKWHGVRITVK